MEQLYRKKENGRYEKAGLGGLPDLVDGIWLVQNTSYSKSLTPLVWRVGDLKRPVDVVTHAALYGMTDKLVKYFMALGNKESEEWKEAKEVLRDWLRDEIFVANVSPNDIISLLLRKIAMIIEEEQA